MVTTNTEPKSRTITLSNAPPVRIQDAQWPIIAQTDADDELGGRRWLKVRQHADSRAIVYGGYDPHAAKPIRGGRLVEANGDIAHAVSVVAAEIGGTQELARDAIAALPVVEL